MRRMSRTVNDPPRPVVSSADLDLEARGSSLAPAVTRAAAILDALAESPAVPTPLSDLARRLRGVETLPVLTPNSHRRVADLLDDLDEIRRRGYAVDNEETAEGIICLGVAIPQRRPGDGLYALSVTLLKARADPARRDA